MKSVVWRVFILSSLLSLFNPSQNPVPATLPNGSNGNTTLRGDKDSYLSEEKIGHRNAEYR